MPAPSPTIADIERGIARYDRGERPWRQTLNQVDWFIVHEGQLYPLKYTFALAVSQPPTDYTTDQMKAAMRHLGLVWHSLKAQREIEQTFQARVADSLRDDRGRTERLRVADPTPKKIFTYQITFQRNPDVVAEVLRRAGGHCEDCGSPAPFIRTSDGTPYLEVHHIIFLADGGEDTVPNAQALCPNCHRRKHFGQP
jgi:5-methylcytosine-specific restriction enzyme A